jgi:hypothetical protein
VTNPYRTQRERAAYESGLAAGRTEERPKGKPKPLSRARVQAMTAAEVIERQAEIDAWLNAGQPEPEPEDDDDE